MSQILAGAALVTPTEIIDDGWLEVEDGRIVALGSGAPPRPPEVALDGGHLTPGFIDIHVHGGGGASVIGADPAAVAVVAEAHRGRGTTTMVASLESAPPEDLARDVVGLADLVEQGLVIGTHLEGPWIAPERCGAHDRRTLRDPDPSEVATLLRLGRGTIRMVTLAPEWPSGLAAVRRLVEAGVIAAIGHTDASYDQTRAAIEAGATVSTHLFNAMRPVSHRAPGPIVALTEDPRVTNEVIVDGLHVDPAAVSFAWRAAEDRVVIVSDALPPAAAGGDGDYRIGGMAVRVRRGVARLVDGGALAGSTLTLDRMVRIAIEQVGVDPVAAVRAVTATPARILGLTDRGVLAPGARADLCHLDDGFVLRAVWVGGEPVAR